jgi:hypothetical protein
VLIDPSFREIDVTIPTDRVLYQEGLDSWDIGIENFKSLKKTFMNFREEWESRLA